MRHFHYAFESISCCIDRVVELCGKGEGWTYVASGDLFDLLEDD